MRTPSRIKVPIFLIVTFFLCSTSAYAWHIEYNVDNMYFEDNAVTNGGIVTKFQVSEDLPTMFDTLTSSWEVATVVENQDGSVDVTYNIDYGEGNGEGMGGGATFSIVSDYGNMASIAIDSILNEYVVAEGDIIKNDPGDTLETETSSFAWLTNGIALAAAGAPDLAEESFGSDFDEDFVNDLQLTLFTNTEYMFSAELFTEAWSELVFPLPDTFFDMNEYDNFVASNGDHAFAEVDGHAGMFWEIEIDGTETPVPEPATILLFAVGIIGLAGSRAIKKK